MSDLRRARTMVRLMILLGCLLPVVGCNGCRQDDDPTANADNTQPEPEILTGLLRTMPTTPKMPLSFSKPGHWGAAYRQYKATRQDYRGTVSLQPHRGNDGPAALSHSDYGINFVRPVALAKGQEKRFDLRFYLPPLVKDDSSTTSSRYSLQNAFDDTSGRNFAQDRPLLATMQAHEYFVVLLTTRPSEWTHLTDDDWVKMNVAEMDGNQTGTHYRLMIPATDGVLALADNFLDWTSTAIVLWDDLSPDALTADQQQALMDWVQWGGRIVFNGPSCAPEFRASFLEPLMPISGTNNSELEGNDLDELIDHWTIQSTGPRQGTRKQQTSKALRDTKFRESSDLAKSKLAKIQSMPAAMGNPVPGAISVHGTDDLVVSHRCGRGNTIATRFDLTGGWMRQWLSASGFYNGALLNRPARDYRFDESDLWETNSWTAVFAGHSTSFNRDPRITTSLRILSRDSSLPASLPTNRTSGAASQGDAVADAKAKDQMIDPTAQSKTKAKADRPVRHTVRPSSPWASNRFAFHPTGGTGAWNDDSGVAVMAYDLLQDTARIAAPDASFLVTNLTWYLVILVPVNYLVFRLLGRLEWAWLAVPVIALLGAIWIARQAQLDIGFARSRNDINVLELQPEYERAHQTRFLAVYNSLSTTYAMQFESREAALLPYSRATSTALATKELVFHYDFGLGVKVTGLNVPSNTTQMLHAEEMIELGGHVALSDDGTKIHNTTRFDFDDVMIVRCVQGNELQVAGCGPLQSSESVPLSFDNLYDEVAFRDELSVPVTNMMRGLLSVETMQVGEVRMVGRTDETLDSMAITPNIAQFTSQTFVCSTLRYPPLPIAQVDVRPIPESSDISIDEFSVE